MQLMEKKIHFNHFYNRIYIYNTSILGISPVNHLKGTQYMGFKVFYLTRHTCHLMGLKYAYQCFRLLTQCTQIMKYTEE